MLGLCSGGFKCLFMTEDVHSGFSSQTAGNGFFPAVLLSTNKNLKKPTLNEVTVMQIFKYEEAAFKWMIYYA